MHLFTASYFVFNKKSRQKNIVSSLPLDDAYVHFIYARNFAKYGKFWFNYNDPQTGATSPLWVIILSIFFKLGLERYIVFISKILGVIFAIGISIVTFYIIKEIIKNVYFAFLGGLLVALSPYINFAKISGMEVMLFSFLALISVYFFMKNKLLLTGIFNGLAILARPEGYLLLAALLIHFIINNISHIKKKQWKLLIRKKLYFVIPVIIILFPYILYCLKLTGRPLPSTFYMKQVALERVFQLFPTLILDIMHFIIILFENFFNILIQNYIVSFSLGLMVASYLFMYGLLNIDKKKTLSIIIFPWLLIISLLFKIHFGDMKIIFYQSRYFIPVLPFLLIPVMIGLYNICFDLYKKIKKKNIILMVGALILLFLFSIHATVTYTNLNKSYADRYYRNTKNVYDMNIGLAKWVNQNVKEDETIAVHDAGAITYFSRRRTIDLWGLNTYQISDYFYKYKDIKKEDVVLDFLKEQNVSYIITYPSHLGQITIPSQRKDLKEIYRIRISDNSFFDSDVTAVYKINK